MSDSDFSKGQEAIIQNMIEGSISEFRSELDKKIIDQASEIADGKIVEFEKNKNPVWKFWKSPTATGAVITGLVALAALVYDRSYGQRFLDGVLHEIIGTEQYVAAEASNKESALSGKLTEIIENQIDYSDPYSKFNQAVETATNSYINNFETPDHPIPKIVRRITGQRPILVFQGQDIFGQPDEVQIDFPGCDEFSAYLEIYSQENTDFSPPFFDCNLRGFVQDSQSLNIPFFASFWSRSGAPGHDVHLIFSVHRVPSDYSNIESYVSPHINSIDGLRISYVRSSDPIGSPDEIDLSSQVRRLEDNFFYLELSGHVREKYEYDPALNSEQTFLHSIEIREDQNAFPALEEVLAIQALIFINRKPRYVEN